MALNNTLDQMDLIDIYRNFHPEQAKYTFISNAHGAFSKIHHMVGYKSLKQVSENSRKLKSYQASSQITMA